MPKKTLSARSHTHTCAALMTFAWVTACGGTARLSDEQAVGGAHDNPAAVAGVGGQDSGGSAGTSAGGDAGAGSACPPGLPSAEQIATTPRGDQNLELLALRLSDGIIADQDIYNRIVGDVGAIRVEAPRVASISYFPQQDGKGIFLEPDAATFAAMQAGQYHGWDCLNQTYVLTDTELSPPRAPFTSFVELTLKGNYDQATVAKQYEALTGITASPGGNGGGDGSTICVTREVSAWHYVFDEASGDCAAGCIDHKFYHFTTTTAGAVTDLGQIPTTEDSPYTSYDACQ